MPIMSKKKHSANFLYEPGYTLCLNLFIIVIKNVKNVCIFVLISMTIYNLHHVFFRHKEEFLINN